MLDLENIQNEDDATDFIQIGMKLVLAGLKARYGLELNENFTDTPERISRMYDEIFSGVRDTEMQVEEILSQSFPSDYDQMVLLKNIEVCSICPHHLLPVHYSIDVAYIPSLEGQVLGISKLARLVELLARRPVLQEQLTEDITRHLSKLKNNQGAAVIVRGKHYCMVMRGARQPDVLTITSSLKGMFLEAAPRQEFMALTTGGTNR